MTKLISVTEAAKLLGISRQTLENWGSRGVINIKEMGGHGHSHFVDQDTIEVLADTMQDVERGLQMLASQKKELAIENKRLREQIASTRKDIIDHGRLSHLSNAKYFYLSLICITKRGILICTR